MKEAHSDAFVVNNMDMSLRSVGKTEGVGGAVKKTAMLNVKKNQQSAFTVAENTTLGPYSARGKSRRWK